MKNYLQNGHIVRVTTPAGGIASGDALVVGVNDDASVALLPADTPGIDIGRRHFPLNNPFPNGPIRGKDVFVPLDYLLGGTEYAGKGWRMLVESLSVGRAISLPSSTTGGAKLACLATGAYARIRKQFGLPIGKFHGVGEVLARGVEVAVVRQQAEIILARVQRRGGVGAGWGVRHGPQGRPGSPGRRRDRRADGRPGRRLLDGGRGRPRHELEVRRVHARPALPHRALGRPRLRRADALPARGPRRARLAAPRRGPRPALRPALHRGELRRREHVPEQPGLCAGRRGAPRPRRRSCTWPSTGTRPSGASSAS